MANLADHCEGNKAARELFDMTNARLFLQFQPVQMKKRTLNKIASSVVTFGASPPPIEIYEGPSGRRKVKGSATQCAVEPGGCESPTPPESVFSGGEGKSLGNVSRGDWRFHDPNTLPQWMTSLSLLACSFAFTAEMYSDFAESFQS